MKAFETSATVEAQGQLRLSGVPFAPGTQVEVTISPKVPPAGEVTREDDEALTAARDCMRELFQTVRGFRNSPRIGREELYDRGRVH